MNIMSCCPGSKLLFGGDENVFLSVYKLQYALFGNESIVTPKCCFHFRFQYLEVAHAPPWFSLMST